MQLNKTSITELSKRVKRKFVLFGSGNISKKTIKKIGIESVVFIADNSVNLQGTTYEGLDIKNPENITSDYFVLICSTAIREISEQLASMGLKANEDFSISPVLNDLLAIQELENLERTFYFTSGSVPQEKPLAGGGFYKCVVRGLDIEVNKLYSGPCYGSVKVNDTIYFVDTDKGIFSCTQSDVIAHQCELPIGSRAHGISYNTSTNHFYVTCSYLDSVLEIDSYSFEMLREFKLSNKLERSKEPMHHCNDNCTIGNSLFVSMFSSTGQWKLDCFDGCVAEFDIETGERLNDVYSGLYMPHNIMIFESSLHVLDSLPGHLRYSNFSVQGTFPAFTRGLCYSEGHYYIGQSKNRNYSKVMGMSNNVSIDCGVIVFNPELKVSRFLQFPYSIGEIHSIVIR